MSETLETGRTAFSFRERWGPIAVRVLVVAVVAALLAGLLFLSQMRHEPLKVSGFIEADEIRVGSRVGGRVARVPIEEGQPVQTGDLLVELEPFDLHERRAEAESILAQRKRTLEKLRAGFRSEEVAQAKARYEQLQANLQKLKKGPRPQEIAAARAEVELAQSNLELARLKHQRIEGLVAKNAASQDDLDEATTQLKVARAEVQVKQEKLSLLEAGTREEEIDEAEARVEEAYQAWMLKKRGYRPEEIAEAEAAVEAAQAMLEAIDEQIEELRIRAPVNAAVEAVELEPGDLVTANAPAISLVDTSRLWVRAYVPEDELDLQVGQRVEITVDSYPDRRFTGKISFVARQGEFTPSNVQTPEERSKQVFRIKVVLLEGLDRLRPGMAADVWLEDRSEQK